MIDQTMTPSPNEVKSALHNAGFKLAVVQAVLQNPGESLTDQARMGADMAIDDVVQTLNQAVTVLQAIA
jgi:hypothetical protein